MAKTTMSYWNALQPGAEKEWQTVAGMEGIAEAVTLAIDAESGDYSRLTRFLPGSDTTPFGAQVHDYPEEVLIVEGRLYDVAFDRWLCAGDYASRPAGDVHGPYKSEAGCVVFEVSFPSQAQAQAQAQGSGDQRVDADAGAISAPPHTTARDGADVPRLRATCQNST
jgi:hypothetical protein